MQKETGDLQEIMLKQCGYDARRKPNDYVVATKKQYSIKDFLKLAFAEVGIKDWKII